MVSKREFLKLCLASTFSWPLVASGSNNRNPLAGENHSFRVCFGSCHFQSSPQTHWAKIAKHNPDLWLWLGDNIYGDTRDLNILKEKYQMVLKGPYGRFRNRFPVDGIWDDHDFGEDGANRLYPHKVESQKLHHDFMGLPKDHIRRKQEGIYHTRTECEGKVKFYFLDTRYFKEEEKGKGSSLLGEKQWQWLEREMEESTALINIFVTPIGFLLNRLFVTEDWAEYPDDKKRLLDKIEQLNLSGIFFMSGDKHFGSFIKRGQERNGEKVDYYEFQSSGLTHVAPKGQLKLIKKFYGKRNCVLEKNFGRFDLFFEGDHTFMTWSLFSLERNRMLTRNFFLNQDNIWVRA